MRLHRRLLLLLLMNDRLPRSILVLIIDDEVS